MKVIYESVLALIDKHIRAAALSGRAIKHIEFTDRTELVDFHSELYAQHNRKFPSLYEFAGMYRSYVHSGVDVTWPEDWSTP